MLDACQHASVFGGMGSWNDQSFAGAEGEAYERVSERLFRALNRAIAIGHPIGASGARVLTTLRHEMQKRGSKKGLATLCIGGGMGVALTVER